MGSSIGVLNLSFVAEGDLSASQYCDVTLGTAANTVKICGVADKPIGVLQNKPTAGQAATVRVLGTSIRKANGAFSKGDLLSSAAATGKVDTALPGTSLWVSGQALTASGATNDEIEATVFVAPLDITLASLADVGDGVSGADQIGMTPIALTGLAATVQAIVEALVTRLIAIADNASGADAIGATAIAELGVAATVQGIIEALAAQKVRGSVVNVPVNGLVNIALNDLLMNGYTPGFAGKIAAISFVTGLVPASTGGKDIDLQCLVGAVPTTGGLLTLLTADVNAKGKTKAGTAITGNNIFTATDTISLKCVEATAAFSEGAGTVMITLLPG